MVSEAVIKMNEVKTLSKKDKKMMKKEKKRVEETEPETKQSIEKNENEIDADEARRLKKKEKKDKKKKRKLESTEEAMQLTEAVTETETTADESAKKKKQKKGKNAKKEETKETTAPTGPYQQSAPTDGSYEKAFYRESKDTQNLSDEAVKQFHQANEILLSGNHCMYKPVLAFKDSGFPQNVLKCCEGFEKPTPIQSQCWPILASGRDIVGIAETGSGKTLAFSLPGLIHISKQEAKLRKASGPIMLVVAPTRELAMQSSEVISKAGNFCGISSACIYGGVPKYEQKKILKSGVHVVVATPGRLKDLVSENSCNLAGVTYLVLDEADRMLDEGFEKDIRMIISSTHPERQIAMFSATWPESVKQLAHEFLTDHVKVTIGSEDLGASQNITQIVEVVEERSRDSKIHDLLQRYHASRKNRILLFVLYKKEAARVESMLQRKGWNCVSIHGDKSQPQRTDAVEKFKNGSIPLLIATDVAARGLDIPGVEYVLNYSFPLTIEDYVHRIGRTGRGGNKGTAHTYFTDFDKPRAGELVNLLRDSNQPVPEALTKYGTHVKKKEHKLYGAFSKNVDVSKKATKITFESDDE